MPRHALSEQWYVHQPGAATTLSLCVSRKLLGRKLRVHEGTAGAQVQHKCLGCRHYVLINHHKWVNQNDIETFELIPNPFSLQFYCFYTSPSIANGRAAARSQWQRTTSEKTSSIIVMRAAGRTIWWPLIWSRSKFRYSCLNWCSTKEPHHVSAQSSLEVPRHMLNISVIAYRPRHCRSLWPGNPSGHHFGQPPNPSGQRPQCIAIRWPPELCVRGKRIHSRFVKLTSVR